MDEPQGEARSLQMTAHLVDVHTMSNPRSGAMTYRLKFEYPRAFIEYITDLGGEHVDVWWNGVLAGRDGIVGGQRSKPPTDKDDAVYTFGIDLPIAATRDINMNAEVENGVGELRMVMTQTTAGLV